MNRRTTELRARNGLGPIPITLCRRTFLGTAALGLAGALLPPFPRAAAAGLRFEAAEPFSFERLVDRAAALARKPYQPPYRPAPELVEKIVYQVHGEIRYRPDHALFAEGPGVYPATFFHLGKWFPSRVRMYAVNEGSARELIYSPSYFDMPADSIARGMPEDSGFAGFRLQESRRREDWRTQDWVAFLGASYVRAIGALGQYGMSARGIAVDPAMPTPEEFPNFVAFYIAPALREEDPVTVSALLDGPSITGAYRFALRRTEGVIMDVDTHLFLRRDIGRLGIAPLTSMFWYGEYGRERIADWRPEVHDSDGLALWNGAGERIWRPLNNPRATTVSSFADENPRGFGLLQRDRNPDHYLDGVLYERRPSVWVEPLGDWGRGTVQLMEIPTDDEIHDNIGAFWTPSAPARAGQSHELRYRLHWLADEPYPATGIARVTATREGRGGEPGKPRPAGVRKFVVEFEGAPLGSLGADAKVEPVITASRGELSYIFVEPVPGTERLRAQFDLTATGKEPVELRLYLRSAGTAISETWLYQHHPA